MIKLALVFALALPMLAQVPAPPLNTVTTLPAVGSAIVNQVYAFRNATCTSGAGSGTTYVHCVTYDGSTWTTIGSGGSSVTLCGGGTTTNCVPQADSSGNVAIGTTVPATFAVVPTGVSGAADPVVTPTCTGTCASSWGYQIAACTAVGCSIASNEVTTSTGSATLDGSHFNSIATGPVAGSSFCAVWRTTNGVYGIIGRPLCGATLQDTGQTPEYSDAWNYTYPPAYDFSIGSAIKDLKAGNYPIGFNYYKSPVVVTSFLDTPDIGSQFFTEFYPSSASYDAIGMYIASDLNGSNPAAGILGYEGHATANSTSTVTYAAGVHAVGSNIQSTITDRIEGLLAETAAVGGTTPLAYGVHITNPAGAAVIGKAVGLKVENQTRGTLNNAIETGLGKVVFGDVVSSATAIATLPLTTSSLPSCVATTGVPWRASVNDATAPTIGAALTGGGSVFANVHCSLATGTYLVDGL